MNKEILDEITVQVVSLFKFSFLSILYLFFLFSSMQLKLKYGWEGRQPPTRKEYGKLPQPHPSQALGINCLALLRPLFGYVDQGSMSRSQSDFCGLNLRHISFKKKKALWIDPPPQALKITAILGLRTFGRCRVWLADVL